MFTCIGKSYNNIWISSCKSIIYKKKIKLERISTKKGLTLLSDFKIGEIGWGDGVTFVGCLEIECDILT